MKILSKPSQINYSIF